MINTQSGLGLKWRIRSDGTRVAYWVCSGGKIHRKFRPRTVRLWSGTEAPSTDAMAKIEEQCRQMQHEMHELASSPHRTIRPQRRSGKIYFIRSRNLVKIGYTAADPKQRLLKLQIGSGERLTLLGVVEGDQVIEKQMHWRFKKQHSHGEWFFLQGALRSYIAKLFAEEPAEEQAENKA